MKEHAHTTANAVFEHCAPYQYNSSIRTLGVASEKSIKINIPVVMMILILKSA